ncbi:MAG: hypothetical protein LC797_17650 [Chloroflexi bacterium]|nr:hypothetical protein [Chloroflexota bacterium]
MKTPGLSDELSDLTENVRKATHLIRKTHTHNLTADDRTALREVLAKLETLVRTARPISSH